MVPKTRSFIDSIANSQFNLGDTLNRARQQIINDALAKPSHYDASGPFQGFAIAYADASKWVERQEWSALEPYTAGNMEKAEEMFLEVDEHARSFIQSCQSFDDLVLFFPTEPNLVILYSSVALYYLCQIRANPHNGQIQDENSEAHLMFAAEHA